MTTAAPASTLASLLHQARQDRQPLTGLDPAQAPANPAAAYAVHKQILGLRDVGVAGWKVGSKSSDGPIQAAPLPADGVHPTGVQLRRDDFQPLALELEVAFRFNRRFEPGRSYSDEEVMQAIGSMGPTIELVTSRYADWPKVEPLWQLADLMSHGALVVGEFIPYREDFPFAAPSLTFEFAGERRLPDWTAVNTAGDPRRLLPWLVNHCTAQGIVLTPETVVTTGSYIGMYFAEGAGAVKGSIAGLPAVELTLV
ncbi:2-keto-4-pentenoate hydratase [Pseudomonas sp. UBA6310]|uniref:2-keto-4-pentenoate hydratase n=1 Tax=Pseudomonas sp. UBA6310 TaxID=1947327 RepID=UPI00257C1432|nr:2-keto-4-pentenoate hydratase [Pseudomonas sp. UBA6310]